MHGVLGSSESGVRSPVQSTAVAQLGPGSVVRWLEFSLNNRDVRKHRSRGFVEVWQGETSDEQRHVAGTPANQRVVTATERE